MFVYAILILSLLSTVYLSMRPSDTAASTKDVRDALRRLDVSKNAYDEQSAAKAAKVGAEE